MAESTYEIVFNGELVQGAERDTVITNLAGLFKTNNEKIARLFGGGEFIPADDVCSHALQAQADADADSAGKDHEHAEVEADDT